MTYIFRPQGVCSQQMKVELDEQGIIQELQVMGGCHGNLQGIAALVKGPVPLLKTVRLVWATVISVRCFFPRRQSASASLQVTSHLQLQRAQSRSHLTQTRFA